MAAITKATKKHAANINCPELNIVVIFFVKVHICIEIVANLPFQIKFKIVCKNN